MSETKENMDNFILVTKKCNHCGDVNVGTIRSKDIGSEEFLCANCDRENFEAVSEAQKKEYLAGSSAYSC